MTTSTDRIWMTQKALDRLVEELGELEAAGHAEDATEQARVLELRELIRRAEVASKPDDGLVEEGMIVTIRFTSDDSIETFLLGDREVVGASGVDIDVSSVTSPLGKAINGRSVGDVAEFEAPNGHKIEVAVVAVVPFA